MPFVYVVLTVVAGLFFYWLRNNHRVWYGLSEILAALALMYLVYFPHGGPGVLGTYGSTPPSLLDILTPVAVPFLPVSMAWFAAVITSSPACARDRRHLQQRIG